MLLASLSAEAAILNGIIYDTDLNPQGSVIIEVDTVPKQKIVSRDGSYGLEIPPGTYTIKASYFKDNLLYSSAEESIEIRDNGAYTLDLILLPSLGEKEPLFEEPDIPFSNENSYSYVLFLLFIPVVFLIFLGMFVFMKKKRFVKKESVLESDLEKLVNILKNKGKRAAQKDLRKDLGLSEAKVSLMVADLESMGIVKKIKKGRGNIIILVEN